jgi:hypothetical protein
LPAGIVISVTDAYKNVVSGVPVTFGTGSWGGSFSPNPVNSNSLGQSTSFYTLPTKAAMLTLNASITGAQVSISEQAVAGIPSSLNMVSGNNQSAAPNTLLPKALVLSVKDRYGNLISGATVAYTDNGANGKLSSASVITGINGQASVTYITPATTGTVTITASLSGVGPLNYTEKVQ